MASGPGRPQYHENHNNPTVLERAALEATKEDFVDAIERAVELIATRCPPPPAGSDDFGNIFTGSLGMHEHSRR